MPWFFSIPEFLKKRACRYLLQHYLGQFLEEKISLEDLTVDLYNGTGSIHNIPLNVQAINDTLKGAGVPVEVVAGFIEQVTVSVPWSALLTESCTVEISGLTVCVAPQRLLKMEEYMSMTDSLFFSMTTSRQMAEEVLRNGGGDTEQSTGFEGMETLARAIELVLARVQISLKDILLQVNYEAPEVAQTSRHFLQLRIGRVEYYDEVSKVESTEGEEVPLQNDFAIKILHLSDLSLELGTSLLPSNKETLESSLFEKSFSQEQCGVPIAVAGGKVTLKVTIKQNDLDSGPKFEVDGFLSTFHLLLSPQQLTLLQQIIEGIAAQANSGGSDFERLPPGQSRPIPHRDRNTLESQLSRHQQLQQHKTRTLHQQGQDLLDADPWENSLPHRTTGTRPLLPPHLRPSDSMSTSANDNFFSLDLTSSTVSYGVAMEDSFASTTSQLSSPPAGAPLPSPPADRRQHKGTTVHHRCSDDFDEAIALHEGVGLQQLSQSPPTQHPPPRKPAAPQTGRTPRPPSYRYSFALGGLTVALLEANPTHTYTTPLERDSTGGVASVGCSIDEGGLDPVRYFELVSSVLRDGVNQSQFEYHHKTLAQILPADHLMLWMSVVRASVNVIEDRQWECEVSVGCGEMWEYLYHNHTRINHITTPVSVAPSVQLHGDPTVTPPKPGLKLKVSTTPHVHSGKKSQPNSVQLVTNVEAYLSGLHVNLDLTLMDRLQLLLHGSPSDNCRPAAASLQPSSSLDRVKHSLYMTSSNMHTIQQQRQAVFHQAIAPPTTSHSRNHKCNIKISGDVIHASLRFPIPVCDKTQQPPWFTSALRNEVLFLELEQWSVNSHLTPLALAGEAVWKMDFQFALAQAFLSLDGSVLARELFLVMSKKSEASSGLETVPTLSLEVQPVAESSLEQDRAPPTPSLHTDVLDLLEESVTSDAGPKPHPQPFSQRRSMFSAGGDEGGGRQGEEVHSEEQVLPGTVSEMKEFADFAASTSHYHLNCFFPEVKVHLPSKQFLETLYNRLGSDLLLWEPATPTSASKANAKSVMYSCMDLLQPAATSEDRFLMCKSVLQEENSDEESDVDSPPVDVGGATKPCGWSYLALSVRIDEGYMSMFPETTGVTASPAEPADTDTSDCVNSELFQSTSADSLAPTLVPLSPAPQHPSPDTRARTREHGVVIAELQTLQLFFVSCFKADPTHECVCGWIQDLALYHHGNPNTPDYQQYSCVETTFDLSVCDRLFSVLGPAPLSLPHAMPPSPMLSLAMESCLDEQNSTKTSKVSVSVGNTALLYRFTAAGLGPIQQLANFLDLKAEEMEGYEPPSLVVELHFHLSNCHLEYHPLYLPLLATVVLDSVSLSTSVVAGAPVHVVRVVMDGLRLLLTPTQPHPQAEAADKVRGHSVCVMEVEWLEVNFKHCDNTLLNEDFQKLFSHLPDVSVECASNVVHFRLCEDSCVALCDLLRYISVQQDLAPPPPLSTADYCSLPASLPPPPPPSSTNPGSPHTTHHDITEGGVTTDIGDLISDAMEDSSPSDVVGGAKKVPHPPKKMAVRVSGQTLLMDFDSDSDTENEVKKPCPPSSPGKVYLDDIFSDSDDDFCIVNTPTSTRVAPGAEPKVKSLLQDGEEIVIVEDHFSLPDGQMDQLQRPRSFPNPRTQYTLKEMSVVWHLYGGRDFSPPQPPKSSGGLGKGRESQRRTGLKYWDKKQAMCVHGTAWKLGGGPGRDHMVLVEMELDKVRLQYEVYPEGYQQSGRLVLLIGELEMRDKLAGSHINKLLYQYNTETMPKQSHASMVTVKVVFGRSEVQSQQDIEEASVYVSVLPIRLNMDQDTVLFLYEFLRHVTTLSQLPVPECEVTPVLSGLEEQGPAHTSSQETVQQVFIKSFTFNPDLPIRIDYEAKGFKTEMGTFAGILLGLSHLNNSQLTLKALHYKKGLLGWDKLMEYATTEWVSDIRGYQLPLLLKGVGPMHNVTQLVYGLLDFVRLPYQQYQEDGRLVWGLQRGTTALTSSTGVAVVELTGQLLETIQSLAQMAYDLVSPTERAAQPLVHQHKPYQPLDFREGFSNAYDVVYAGIGGTAVDLYSVASREHQERGMTGAVGGVLRHLPGTFVKPIILASEATRHVLGGVKNQFVPDARKEAHEKWKSNDQSEDSKKT